MVDRRRFLIGLGAGVASLRLPAFASPAPSCKIIGIGATGCNLAVALRESNILDRAGALLSSVCVDLGSLTLYFVEGTNDADPALTPIIARVVCNRSFPGQTLRRAAQVPLSPLTA